MFFDSHAHIASSSQSYADIDAVIKRAREAGLIKIVDAAIDIKTSKAVLDFHFKYPDFVIPTIGLQPELLIPGSDIYDQELDINLEIRKLKELYDCNEGKFKAVGECGLDYYWIERGKRIASSKQRNRIKGLQRILFKEQIDFAREVRLPLIVHSRGAEEECLKIINSKLKIQNSKLNVLFHCYTGSLDVARKIFEDGYYISFNNILTYPKASDIWEILKLGWSKFRKQVLSETDSPYLPPQHRRGEICEPRDVVYVIKEMARIVDETCDNIATQTMENASVFYSV
jgi:TatD DNase family protein